MNSCVGDWREDGMTDRPFLRLNDRWTIGFDHLHRNRKVVEKKRAA